MFGTYGFLTRDVTVPARGRYVTIRKGARVYVRSTDARRQTVTIDADGFVAEVAASYVR